MTGPALLRTILERPDDDGARLVYADWCRENGDAERAELIQVQIAWARCENRGLGLDECKPCEARQPRERELLTAHGMNFLPEIIRLTRFSTLADGGVLMGWMTLSPTAGDKIHATFARGFVASVTCDASSWLAHGDAVLAAHPAGEVRLTTRPEIRQGGCLRWTESEADGGVRLYAQWDVAVGGRIEQQNLRVCLAREYAADLGAREQFDRKVDAARTPEGYFAARWPAVKTWHLPPEPWTADDEARAVNGDPDAPLPLGVMDVEERRASSAAPDARRRAGHSRMPGWLVERRGQRPPRR